jgi:regulator of nonsense transcripts 2
VLGFTIEQADKMREDWKAAKEAEAAEPTAEEKNEFGATEGAGGDGGSAGFDGPLDSDPTSPSLADAYDPADGEPKDGERHATLTALLEKLPECINKQKADEFTVGFCHYNSKAARKRLVSALIHLPRGRTELTATYSRIIASIARLFPDVVEPINDALRREFFGILRSRNQYYIDSKIKNVRFCGELVKFKAAPPITAFRMCKALFADFTNHNVELLSVLLETCGRFLYLMPLTHHRTEEVLDTMLRLRRAKNLDMRQQSLLENAYFAVKPPEKVVKEVVVLTTVQKYATYLIIERLG